MVTSATRIFIVGPPRGGASLLQQVLTADPAWSRGQLHDDVGFLWDTADPHLGHRLADAPDEQITELRSAGSATEGVTVEWSPRWSLRIPLLRAAFPEARFIVMTRRPLLTVASAMTAWRSGRFVSAPDLAGWWGEPWSFPVIPGWQALIGAPLGQVCAQQWATISDTVWQDLADVPPTRWTIASMEALTTDPAAEVTRLARELELSWQADQPLDLRVTATSVTAPGSEAWRGNASEAAAGLDHVPDAVAHLQEQLRQHRPDVEWGPLPAEPPAPAPVTMASAGTEFSSEHTASLVDLLRQAGVALTVSTYKSGHVIVARARERLDTEFLRLDRPMGIAVDGNRLAVGTGQAIHEFISQTALVARLPTPDQFSTVYAPMTVSFTGDVAIHDMAYGADRTLYFVNTLFSCLCRRDFDASFTPVWQPPWISRLADEDRCHLNGLALVDGEPRYVSALATTDTAGGWREHRGTGGVIVDVRDNRIVAEGLSMPHSPRWHDGQLWVLLSGTGGLAQVDLTTGAVTVVAQLPGFTRGLAFIGPYALVGLSQVRESVFTGLPVTSTAAERNCGVWVVDTRTGETVGLWRFGGMVQELFDVVVVPARWPTLVEAGDLTSRSYVLSPETLARLGHP